MHRYRISGWTAGAVIASAATFAMACADGSLIPTSRTYKGAQVAVGAGVAWTEMAFDGDVLQRVSIVFSAGALHDLPETLPNTEYVLPFPSGTPSTVFNHAGINWQPQGHPPPMIYTVPHFDVHYYLVSEAERNAMTPADPAFAAKAAAMPTATEIPPGYQPDPQGIPRMGTHWTDAGSHEFHGSPFTNTMVYGFYEAKMIFIEPMMTRAFLLGKPDETKTLQVPRKYPKPGAYPTSYRVHYKAGEYRIDLLGFVKRH